MEEAHLKKDVVESKFNQGSQKRRKPKKLPVAISEEEFKRLLKHTYKKRHKAAFILGFGSGLRISEIIHLEKRHINFKERTILVEQGKGSKDRIVPLAKGFKTKYLRYIPVNRGPRALERSFKRAAERAGLLKEKPPLHFHSLRHGFATTAVSHSIPIHHVRTLMGHTNIATTNVYLEMNPKEALKSYEERF